MPIVPFVTTVKVYASIFVKVVTSNNVHCSGLGFIVHGTAVANCQRKVVYWSSYWLPEADEMEGKLCGALFLGVKADILYDHES
jgi:hypothetical protein